MSFSIFAVAGFASCSQVKNDVAGITAGASGGSSTTPRILSFADGNSVNLGSIAVGGTYFLRLPISSTGSGNATVSSASNSNSYFAFNGGAFPGTGGTCTTPISGNCSIAILFTAPTTVAGIGSYSDSLVVEYTSGGVSRSIAITLSAAVSAGASLSINSGTPYDFGSKTIGTSTDHSLTVTNSGGLNALDMAGSGLTAPIIFKGGSYPGTGGTCGTSLASGASCTLVTTFTPTASVLSSKTLSMSYTVSGVTNTATLGVSGTGVTLASLSITSPVASPYDYGNVTIGAAASDATFTFSNSGGQSATSLASGGISAPFTFKGGSYPGTGGTCGTSLAAAATCTMVVSFLPTSAGLATATLSTTYDNGSGSTQTLSRSIQGTGLTPASLSISDGTTYDYGSKVLTTTNDKTFTVTNSGGTGATSISATALVAPYTFAGGTYPGGGTCGTTLAASATCTIIVRFTPTAAVTSTDTLTLGYSNGVGTVSSTRALTGTGISAASLSINGGVAYGFGSKNVGTSTDQTLTVSNSGSSAATAMSASGLSAPTVFKGGSYPGTGGTCGLTLAASASCTVVVTYSPTAAGLLTRTLSISYNNGATTTSATNAISGTGVALATLSITTPVASPYDYGTLVIGATAGSVTVTLSNTGGQAATSLSVSGLSAPITYKGGFYPGTGGTCGTSLAASSTCTMVVDFTPTSAVLSTVTLTASYNDGSATSTMSKNMQGTGATPASLSISDGATYDFGTHYNGSTTNKTFTITNSGGSTATSMSGTAPSAPYSFPSGYPGGGTCGATLAAGSTCTVIVSFSPVAGGSFTDTITIPYDSGVTTTSATRAVTGVGGAVAVLSIDGGVAYDFGTKNAGTSTDYSLTVANSGGLTATALSASGLSAPINFKGGTYPGTGGTCGTTLASGATCSVIVTFAPTASAVSSKTLSISYNDASATTSTTLGLSGTGITLASVSITTPVASPFDYGSVVVGSTAVDQTFTFSNTGGQTATAFSSGSISAPFAFKGGAYPGTGGNCGATLAASATCTVVVSYLPTSPVASVTTLVTTYNDGSSTITLNEGLQGTGISTALLSISETGTYDYGSRTVGTTLDHSFTVTNSGGGTATSVSATALVAPFTFKGGAYPGTGGNCGNTLAGSGATCTLVVTFSPVAAGGFSDTIDLSYNDGTTTLNSTRSITGTGGTVANLSLSDGPSYSFGSIAKGYSSTKLITVTNSGSASASSISVSGLAAPIAFTGGSFPGTSGTCGTTLGASGTCTLDISFSPTSAGASSVTLSVDYNNSVTTTSSTRDIDGVGATITKIVGGGDHTCALYNTGIVKCWGSDFSGQLGNGGTNTDSLAPVTVSGITTAVDLAAGTDHTCAVLANGRAKCWGSDTEGQLGNDASLSDQGSPALVATVTDFILISAGGNLTCGLRSGGTVVCFGSDAEGGNGNDASFTDNATPVTVSGLTGATDISVGRAHACSRKSDDSVQCWGANLLGQLGDATNTSSGIPVTPMPGTTTTSAAGGDVSCAILSGGAVLCWGSDDNGQLGDDVTLASKNSPVTVAGLANSASLALGMKHGCAKTSGATVTCFGDDFYGQLGDNVSTTDEATPAAVSGLSSVSIIGAGEYHSCAVLSTGAAYCWGANSSGQLGNVSPLVQQATPVLVKGL